MLPLEDIKVVELAQNLAGPFCAQILAHLGAEVIKIEKQTGDDARGWGKLMSPDGGPAFNAVNLSKRSVIADLKNPVDVEKVLRLIDTADVVVQNMRPGALMDMGLGAEALMARNSRLIYCSINAYGTTGPKKLDPGYEAIVQAFSGMMMMSGLPSGPPVRMGAQVLDHGSAMWAAIGILAAIVERQRTGYGRKVDTSLMETAISWWTNLYATYASTGEVPQRHPIANRDIVVYEGLETADGPIIVAAGNDMLFRKLCLVVGKPEWASDPALATNRQRIERRDEIVTELDCILRTKPRAHWLKIIADAGIPCTPINSLPEMLAESQTEAIGMLQPVPNLERNIRLIALPIQFDDRRPPIRNRAPKVGEHTKEVFGEPLSTLARRS
jgi:crotonobetainyl-CoA:carnitine CoA-transferase CaiB-like acyl-CoA transferase